MHKIYDPEVMQDKADAIRYACKLPATEKMTPPEMADKLLQFGDDPLLIFSANDIGFHTAPASFNYTNTSSQTFSAFCYVFDPDIVDMDYDLNHKLEITFNIKELSKVYNASYTIPQLNGTDANNPIRPLLDLRGDNSICYTYGGQPYRQTHTVIDIYQSSIEGLVYCFKKAVVVRSQQDIHKTVFYKIDHAENKEVKIIFDKFTPNNYSVFVDGDFLFTDVIYSEDYPQSSDQYTYIIPPTTIFTRVSIADYCYRVNDNYQSFGHLYSGTDSDAMRYPYGYNTPVDIFFNHISMKYSK